VVTHITTDEINISEDNYFELSLILNEWVTNSIKYAAIPDNRLKIKVSVRQQTREICIDYSDSGTVTSSSVNPPGLGNQIIHLLTVQMGARLTTGAHPYHYQLCIPDGT
jgi:two-component system CheB/CheR fusion protein